MIKRLLLVAAFIVLIHSAVNAQSTNDTLYQPAQEAEEYPVRKILLEEFTGAWCRWCPRSPIIFEKEVKPHYPQVVMVAIHTGDAMAIDNADSLMRAYIEVIPTGLISREVVKGYRNVGVSPESWKGRLDDLDLDYTPVAVSVKNDYYAETREWIIDVEANFVINTVGDYRFNIYVVEDSLTGSGPEWDQKNIYNLSSNEPYMELQGAGNPILGYVHNHVVRRMTGGSWGEDGIIPDSVNNGDSYVYSKTITVPENWNPDHLRVIGIVQEYDEDITNRPILNIEDVELTYAEGAEPSIKENSISLYPNPVEADAILEVKTIESEEFSFEVFSALGHSILRSENHKHKGEKRYALNTHSWAPGIYFVKTVSGKSVKTLRLVKR